MEENEKGLLSAQEKEKILAEVKKQIEKEALEAEKKKFREQMLHEERMRLAREAGTPSSNELLRFKLYLPKYCAFMVVDQQKFVHNMVYVRPRHIVDSLADRADRLRKIMKEEGQWPPRKS